MQRIALYIQLLLGMLWIFPKCMFGGHFSLPPDSVSASKPLIKNREQLVRIVDSLLDLDSIPAADIARIQFYSSFLDKNPAEGNGFIENDELDLLFSVPDWTQVAESFKINLTNDSMGKYVHPFPGMITSPYGWRSGRTHKGMDIELRKGDKIKAAFSGVVRIARKEGAYGNVVILRHFNGLETVYAHLSKISVKPGELVTEGEVIGQGGSTGRSTGPHLHFELRYKGVAFDPREIIDFEKGTLKESGVIFKKVKNSFVVYPEHMEEYHVQRGDTWSAIARRFGLPLQELYAINPGVKKYLREGQAIHVHLSH